MPRRKRAYKTGPDKDVRKRPLRNWTIMIYMAGDNNLSSDMANSLGDLEQLADSVATGGSGRAGGTVNTKANVLAYFDSASLTAPTQYIDYTDRRPRIHDVTQDDLDRHKGVPSKRETDPEDSASARSIMSFVRWCIKRRNAKARNYILIFSAHGFGFYGNSFLSDQSSGRYLSLRRFRYALEEARNLYLFPDDPTRKIAIVGFDSCEMGMLEVGYELKDVAQTIVASAGNVPNAGWGYAPMLRQFLEGKPSRFFGFSNFTAAQVDPQTPEDVKDAARRFVHQYVSAQQRYAISGNSVDMAAIDLDKIPDLASSVGALGEKLMNMLGLRQLLDNGRISQKDALVHNRTKTLLAQSRMTCQAYMHEQSVDIKDFCQKLMFGCRELEHEAALVGASSSPFPELQRICKKVIRASEECVLQSGYSGDEYQYSKGISLYFPWTALTYLYTWWVYGKLRFSAGKFVKRPIRGRNGKKKASWRRVARGPGEAWDDFLLFYLYVVTLRQPEDVDAFDERFKMLDSGGVADGDWQQTRANWFWTRAKTPKLAKGKKTIPWPKATRENWRTGTRENWPLTGTRENPRITGSKENPWITGSKENPWITGSKENPLITGSKENPLITGSRENWPRTGTRENPRITGSKGSIYAPGFGGMSNYMMFFSRIRNFVLDWDAAGMYPPFSEGGDEGK